MKKYYPEVFIPRDMKHAKDIILADTEDGNRWEEETEIIVKRLIKDMRLNEDSIVLDYGCGIGRIAKELINKTNCTIVGVDLSPPMLAMSFEYVNSPNFTPCSIRNLEMLVRNGLRFDATLAVLVLQHCVEPVENIRFIHSATKSNGFLYLFNEKYRCVPVRDPLENFSDWAGDDQDIPTLIKEHYDEVKNVRVKGKKDTISKIYKKKI